MTRDSERDDPDAVMETRARQAIHVITASLRLTAAPLLVLIVACAHDRSARPDTAQPSAAVTAPTAPPSPQTQTNAPTTPTTPATQMPGSPSAPAPSATKPSNPAVKPSVAPRAPATAVLPATAVTPAATAAVAASSPPPRAAVAAAPTLDLKGLEQRLRDTHAIGVFTKLSLKNQVDDLLAQFKAFHQGQSRDTLAGLRQKYELLLMKVVSLLQDGDPTLASAVLSSREAIWSILTDPKKFAAL